MVDNGHMNKAGGYTAAVFFSHEKVDQSKLYGDTLVERGTNAGGQIEVYSSVEDAEKRNDYLSTFDGSFQDSGSHKLSHVYIRSGGIL